MAFSPAAEKWNMAILGTAFTTENGRTKELRAAGLDPGFRQHMSLRHCAVRLVAFAAPMLRHVGTFITSCDTMVFRSVNPPTSIDEASSAVLSALGTDLSTPKPLVPAERSFMETVELVLDMIAHDPHLGESLEAAGFSLEILDLPKALGLTAVVRLGQSHWIYSEPRAFQPSDQPANPVTFNPAAVVKSTRILATAFVGYAGLWADSKEHLKPEAAAA